MPFVFAFVAILLIVVAFNGTQSTAFSLLKSEFTGSGSFLIWAVAILVLGFLGYIKPLKPVANAFLLLVLLVMFISNKGFFASFNQQIRNPQAPSAPAATASSGSSPDQTIQTPFGPLPVPTVTTPNGSTVPVPPAQTPWAPGSF